MNYFLSEAADALDKGIAAERRKAYGVARIQFLKATELLFKEADVSSGAEKRSRVEQAEGVLRHAQTIPLPAGTKSDGIGRARDSEKTPKADDQFTTVERPAIRLSDVAGLEDVKEEVRKRMIYPYLHPDQAARYGVRKGGGLLLWGPPGTGKTLLARAIAGEVKAAFYTVKPSEIMSQWVGVAEQNLQKLFSVARSHDPAVIFIDEIEALAPKRRSTASTVMQRLVPQLLSELDGFSPNRDGNTLLFLGATNEPWSLDEALLRPGRFDQKVYIPPPDFEARSRMFEMYLLGKPLASGISFHDLASLSEGRTGADIRAVAERAADIPFLESIKTGNHRTISQADLLTALGATPRSVSAEQLRRYERYAHEGS